jgi:RNA polymerase sigma-70 factor (ECF subfamily)
MSSPCIDVDALRSAAGDGFSEALGQILQAYRPYLMEIARREMDRALRAKGSASDLVQETFMDATRHFARFHGVSSAQLRAWLRCLLLHRLSKQRRRFCKTRKRGIERECRLEEVDTSLLAAGPTPSQIVSASEQLERFHRAIEALPDDYRLVLQLRYQEGLTFEAIGTRMGRTANAVRLLWLRAVERIKQSLRDEADG